MALSIFMPLVAYFLASTATVSPQLNTCSKHCLCSVDTNNLTSAKCDLSGLNSSDLLDINLPPDLLSLDLSSSGLKKLTKSFFRKFPNITSLDLSYTKLMLPGTTLPYLENLYVKNAWIGHMQYWGDLLSLPMVRFVSGVTWASWSCDQCNISKGETFNITQEPCNNCSKVRMSFHKGTSFDADTGKICWDKWGSGWYTRYFSPSWYLKAGFTLQCMCDRHDCTTNPPLALLYLLNRLFQRLLDHLYLPTAAVLVLNLLIIAVILTSKTLRKSPTLILLLNMAICDLLMALFCSLTAKFNAYMDSDDQVVAATYTGAWMDLRTFHLMCPYITFLFGVTQLASVMTSLLLTVERYLVIVYCMKPGIRMKRKIAAICIFTTWCVAIVYNTYAVFFLSDEERRQLKRANHFLCLLSGHPIRIGDNFPKIPLSVFLGGLYIVLFLCTIPLYIHMYIVVRKSSTQVGVKREGALARKLALLVLTNLVFSVIPLSLGPVLSMQSIQYYFITSDAYSTFKIYVICTLWLPILLLCLNSCINPFIFAFRHHLFKRRLREIVCKRLECFRRKQGTPAGKQRTGRGRRNAVQDTKL